jgi:hypothetical protein
VVRGVLSRGDVLHRYACASFPPPIAAGKEATSHLSVTDLDGPRFDGIPLSCLGLPAHAQPLCQPWRAACMLH